MSLSTRAATGQIRYREHKPWFKRCVLILQLEIRYTGTYTTNGGGRVEEEEYDFKRWEDATIQDLLIFDIKCKQVDK